MSAKDQKDGAAKNDTDLNELLDDALKDFATSEQTAQSSNADTPPADTGDQNAFFMEEVKLFREQMRALVAESGESGEQLTEQIMAGFSAAGISEALKGINEASDTLQGSISEADVAKLFSGLGLGESDETDDNPFLPFMEGMMQSLLSPDILLPGIKDLLEKYPKYLEENGDKLTPEDKERYEKQLDLYKVICNRLESQKPDATPKEKRENYKLVMEDMRKLQEFGQPPEEIVGELTELAGIDTTAAPPTANPQCPMM